MANEFQFDDDEEDAPRPKRGKSRDDVPRSSRPRDEDRPRKRRDDEEDSPRKRRDEEEDRPRSRRRDEDEDDRPRKRRDEPEDDDDDYTPPSRSKKKGAKNEGMNPLRFVSPGTFIIAVVLFFLPWTDLSCSGPTGKLQIMTQSGFESARGKFSEGSGIADMQKEQERITGKKAEKKLTFNEFAEKDGGKKDDDDGPQKAPVLWLYILLLIGGTIVPVLIGANRARGMAVVGFAWFALLLLVVQMIAGFPLSNEAAEMNDEGKNGNNRMAGMGPVPPPPVGGPKGAIPGKANNAGNAAADSIKVSSSFLASFYISIFILVVTGGLGVVQYFMGAPPPKKKKASKKRSRRDDDDDEEDDDDDR